MGKKKALRLYPLDPKFVGAKPIEIMPDGLAEELRRKRRLIIEPKRNGHAAYVSATGARKRTIGIYSRGIRELTQKFPQLVDELRSLNIPKDTLLSGEGVVQVNGIDSPGDFNSLAKSRAEKAQMLQRDGARAELVLFNVIVHRGESVIHLPYRDRLDIVQELCRNHRGGQVQPITTLSGSFAAAQKQVKEQRWEGLVLYDAQAPSFYRTDGRIEYTPRPYGCWKWKPYREGDFIALDWVPSEAPSHKGAVKDFMLYQYSQSGALIYRGKCGIGISREERFKYAVRPFKPLVLEVQYEALTKNGKLVGGRILRVRDDKKPEECFTLTA